MTVQYLLNATGVQLALSGATTHGVLGSKAAETLIGTTANDSFRGNGGGDTLIGGKGDDSYTIYDARDVVVENAGEGVDTVTATVSYTLSANVENLTLTNDLTYGEGNAQNNILTGGNGAQTLDGAGGNDILTGGAGADIFIMRAGGGHDVITDFQTGLDVARLGDSGLVTFAQVQAAMTQVGSDVALNYATGEELLFRNHQVSDFSANNFQLPLNTAGLSLTYDDEFNTLNLYSGMSANYQQGSHAWWTRFSSGTSINSFSLAQNGEQEVYVAPGMLGSGSTPLTVNPFSLSNGVASISAMPTSAADLPSLWNMPYTSGLMTSKLSFAQQYGYFEVRAKLPTGNGLWPAFWLLPLSPNGSAAEIDVFEQLGRDPSSIFQTQHTSSTGTATWKTTQVHVDNPDQFHTYGMLWDKNFLVWYVDGVETSRQATAPDQNSPMYMLLNMAVGGPWAGAVDATTPFPSSMGIDYVHAYALNSSAPSAVADTYGVTQNSALTVGVANGVLANDTTPTSNSLTAALVNGAAHGVVTLAADGSFTYTPDAGYTGADSFSYLATSGAAQSSAATVSLTVNAPSVTAPPVVSGVAVLTASNEDATRTITTAELLSTASDPNGSPMSVTGLTASSGGVIDNHDGTWTFHPAANDDTQVSFTFQVSDGTAATAASATMDLLPVNDPPIVSGPTTLTASNEDAPRVITTAELLALASDVEGDALSVTGLTASSGSLMDNHDGTWTFQPVANDDTQVSFTYQVSDGQAATPATASVDLLPVNDPPVANPDAASVVSGASVSLTAASLLANDTDVDHDPLSIVSVAMGANAHGTVQLLNGVVTYTPTAGYTGADSFTYAVTDGHVGSPSVGTVNITVTAAAPPPPPGPGYIAGTTGNDVINLSTRTAVQSVNGQSGNDTITGGSGADSLNGGVGNDVIVGGAGNDNITGGTGSDIITGGTGADRFTWSAVGEFGPAGQPDVITDFSHTDGDLVALTMIDANSLVTGNQAFSFLGTNAFTHRAGQLDYAVVGSDVMVYGDVNGDGVADFQFKLLGVHSLVSSDFIL